MRYASVCSGVEAASLAWEPLGWEPVWFSQFDPEHNYKLGPDFPSAVLAHRWPHVPNLGDMTKLQTQEVYIREKFNLLVGGTPCQDDSIAGKRKGMDGKRGIIKDDFVRILDDKQPTWFVWENVPGVLSSNGGRNFAAFIGNLKAVGYSFCWRIIDAQYCGVPQRRRRVFIVGHLGDDWRPSAAVLFEPQSMPGYFKPGKSQEQEIAKCLTASAGSSHREDSDNFVVHGTQDPCVSDIAFAIGRNNGGENVLVKPFDMQAFGQYGDGATSSTVKARDYKDATDLVCTPIHDKATRFQGGGAGRNNDGGGNGLGIGKDGDPMYSILTSDKHAVQTEHVVRRLTEVEGERLQGFTEREESVLLMPLTSTGIETCIVEKQKKNVLAGVTCHNEQKHALTVEKEERKKIVRFAVLSSSTKSPQTKKPVVVNVVINLEEKTLAIHKAGKCLLYVSSARMSEKNHLQRKIDLFALLSVSMSTIVGQITQVGKEGCLTKLKYSMRRKSGKTLEEKYGLEISAYVENAIPSMEKVSECLKYITLQADPNPQLYEQHLATLYCFVVTVTNGFIPNIIPQRDSSMLKLTVRSGHTNIIWKGKPAPSGQRYKAIGNSMAVPVMNWIGKRIDFVDKVINGSL